MSGKRRSTTRGGGARARAARRGDAAARAEDVTVMPPARTRPSPATRPPIHRREATPPRTRRGAPGAAGRAPQGETLVAVYHDAARYGPVLRSSLALGLALLVVATASRLAGHTSPAALDLAGTLLLLCFLTISMVRHYRALYRVRRHHAGLWESGNAFAMGLLLAPFGVGLPRPTPLDRAVRLATAALVVALAALLVTASVTHH